LAELNRWTPSRAFPLNAFEGSLTPRRASAVLTDYSMSMAVVAIRPARDPFLPPLRSFLARSALLHGVLFGIETHLRARRGDLESTLKHYRKARQASRVLTGATFVMCDVTQPGPRRPVPMGQYYLKGPQHLRALEDIRHLNAAWTVAYGYEAFETFVQDIAAVTLARRGILANPEWRPSQRDLRSKTRRITDLQRFVRNGFRGAEDVLKRLRRTAQQIERFERANRRTDFGDWFRVVSAVRHAIVHRAAVLSPRQILKLSPSATRVLHEAFTGIRRPTNEYTLRISSIDADLSLRICAEHAFVIYKGCCLAAGRVPRTLAELRPPPLGGRTRHSRP
jgi:hypothetical protein